jgi:hypothetical protein
MTILYDKKDILVNCTSYGLYSTPSPFHWFANRKKVNKLKSEFNNRIKNALQHRLSANSGHSVEKSYFSDQVKIIKPTRTCPYSTLLGLTKTVIVMVGTLIEIHR